MSAIKIYHGSLNKIEKFNNSKCMWFSSILDEANEAILMQDNFNSEGRFGYLYTAIINENEVFLTDDFSKFDDGSILKETTANIVRCTEQQPNWYLVRDVTKLNLKEE